MFVKTSSLCKFRVLSPVSFSSLVSNGRIDFTLWFRSNIEGFTVRAPRGGYKKKVYITKGRIFLVFLRL